MAAVLAPLDELNSDHAELLKALSSGVLVALLVAGLGGAVIGRQALRPLEDMANQATTITEEDPSGRLVAPHPRDELGQLAAAFNARPFPRPCNAMPLRRRSECGTMGRPLRPETSAASSSGSSGWDVFLCHASAV